MALEAGTYVSDLVQSNPPSTDLRKQGDDHLRLIKTVLQNTFPGATKAFYLPTTVTKTTTYTALASDMNKLLLASTTGGAWSLTLPVLATADAGWQITVIKITADVNLLTIFPAAGTIGLDSSVKLFNNYDSAIVSWTGTTWILTSLETKQNVIPWVAAGGAVDVITAAYLPSFSELIDGQYCAIRALGANLTTTPTFSPNGLTARTITKLGGTALVAGDIINSTHELILRYNLANIRWEMLNPGKAFTGGPLSTLTSMTSKAFNMAKGAAVASAATMDIWTLGDGNTIHGTGTSTITSFGTAPQAGADRWLIADAAFTITNNATIIVQGGANYTAAINDVFHILADMTTIAYVEIFKANGAAVGSSGSPSVRQTVATGPVDTAGLPSFLPATSASLSITSQNVTSTAPLAMTAAQGANAAGSFNVTYITTANLTWGAVTANVSNYLYVNTLTGVTGFTTLVPIYQYGGTPAVTNNQFTFNTSEMQGYMGNGTTAPATPLVFVGELVAGAATITSTIAYAYNGYYDSGYTATVPAGSSATAKNSNLGTEQSLGQISLQNTTAELGYSIGDTLNFASVIGNSGAGYSSMFIHARNVTTLLMGNTSTTLGIKTTGVNTVFTRASWSYKVAVRRNW